MFRFKAFESNTDELVHLISLDNENNQDAKAV